MPWPGRQAGGAKAAAACSMYERRMVVVRTASQVGCPYMATCTTVPLPLVLLRIPDFRDRDFRIFKPILKNGFESDPDL
jgi:hypothetical protein